MKKVTAEWVRKAEVDVAAARRLCEQKPPLNDPACFHCQQAVEKYLKALLQELELAVPRTHDLDDLLSRVLPKYPALMVFRASMNRMTQYAVDYRYPGIHASTRQVQSALRFTARVRETIRQCLGIRSKPLRKDGRNPRN